MLNLACERVRLPGDDHGDIDPEIEAVLAQNNYYSWRLANGRVYALSRFIFTWAIVCGIDRFGYTHRFCYESLPEALGAYLAWDCRGGEPLGYLVRK